jgi:GPI mannosyltransferase 3
VEHAERRAGLIVLAAALAVGAIARLYWAFTDDGIFWPDEIYQSLEPAHRLVFGHGLIPWEFIDGARNWALPGFVAFLLKLGGDDPVVYLGLTRVAFIAIAVGTAHGSYLLARAYRAKELPAAVGAACFALGALPLYFGHRAMSETASALPVAYGLWLTLKPDAARKHLALGASLLGLAVLLRLQCGVFAAGALAVLLARKQWRPSRDVFVVLLGWAFLFGLLDRLTWGHWFHSAQKYLEFNLIKGGGAAWGTHPWSHLLLHVFSSMTGVAIAFAVGLAVSLKHARGLALIAFAFFALHSVVPHKEIRFILTVLPLFGACVGVALTHLPKQLAWVVLATAAFSTYQAKDLTWGELGAYPERAAQTAWDDFGSYNRLLLKAGKQPQVCGVFIEGAHLAWVGGSTYLHAKAPLYMGGMQPPQGAVNYVITPREGGEVVARDGALKLVHIPVEPCAPDPGYTWRLP